MTKHVKVAGTWRSVINAPYVKVAGTWRLNTFGYVKIAGTWRNYYTYDTTGPSVVTGALARWNSGPCLVTWTNPPESDFAGVRIDRYRGGTFDGQIALVTAYGPSAAAQYVDNDIRENGTIYTYYLYPYDTLGNYGAGVGIASSGLSGGTARGRVTSPYVVDPFSSGTWRNGAWRGDVGGEPYQGYTSGGMNVGAFFYSGLKAINGATISNMTLDLFRVNSGGQGGGIFPSMWLTQSQYVGDGTDPSASLAFNAIASPLCRNGTCNPYTTMPCPSSWYSGLCSASQPYFGVAMFDPDTVIQSYGTSSNYGIFYGAGETPGFVVPGRITVTHSG